MTRKHRHCSLSNAKNSMKYVELVTLLLHLSTIRSDHRDKRSTHAQFLLRNFKRLNSHSFVINHTLLESQRKNIKTHFLVLNRAITIIADYDLFSDTIISRCFQKNGNFIFNGVADYCCLYQLVSMKIESFNRMWTFVARNDED